MLHIAMPMFIFGTLVNGIPIVFPFGNFGAQDAIRAIKTYKCYRLLGSPRMLHEILAHPECDRTEMASLKTVLGGGSMVTFDLMNKFREKLGVNLFVNRYGMSESLGISTLSLDFNDPNLKVDADSSPIGFLAPFIEGKVVEPTTKRIVPLGQDGILQVRTRLKMTCYFAEPGKTREAIDENDWLDTGDMVSMDKDGCLYFKTRVKELIKICESKTNSFSNFIYILKFFIVTVNKIDDAAIYPYEIEFYISKHENVK